MRGTWIVAALSLGACAKSNTVICGDVTCPVGTHCGTATQCIPDLCGNELPDGIEECDGANSIDNATLRCTDYGFYKGPNLTCSESCTVDTSQCEEFCGDFTINGTERCDGIPATGLSCADFGFDVGTIGCADSCSPDFDFCGNIGWQLVPGGATNELYAVFLASPNSGVAVGRAGQIVAAKDGVWLPVTQTVTSENLNGVFGNTSGILAVGDNGTILRYTGTTVAPMQSPVPNVNLRAISGGVSGAIAVGDNGTILQFDGTSWTQQAAGLTTENLYGVHVVNQGLAFAVGTNGTLLKMDGTVWTAFSIAGGLPVSPVDGTKKITLFSVFAIDGAVFVSGERTTVARVLNQTTAVIASPPADVITNADMRGLWAASETDLYASGSNGTLLHWNGTYLRPHDVPTNRTIFGLDGIGGRLVGVTRGGTVIAFNGTSRHVQAPFAGQLRAVYADATHTVAAGIDLVQLAPNGTWSRLQPDIPAGIDSVIAVGNAVYAGSPTLGLFKSTDNSTLVNVHAEAVYGIAVRTSPSFLVVTVGQMVFESATDTFPLPLTSATTAHGTNALLDVWAAPDGVFWAVGDGGTALRRDALNGTWTAIPTPTTNRLFAVWGVASDDVFAVGTLGTILHWNGVSWRRMHTGTAENLVSISGNTRSDVFVTGTSFTRLHYDGLSWSRMAAYDFEATGVATYRGTTFYVSGNRIERQDRMMSSTELRCGDPFDNDADGKTNCDDDDCKDDPQCRRGGACETLERVTCETQQLATSSYSGVARITDLPCLEHSTPGPEASYRFVATTSGSVTVTIEDDTDVKADETVQDSSPLELVVADAQLGHCDLQTCRAGIEVSGTESVTFTATAGQMYYVIVDGPVGVAAKFKLSVRCD